MFNNDLVENYQLNILFIDTACKQINTSTEFMYLRTRLGVPNLDEFSDKYILIIILYPIIKLFIPIKIVVLFKVVSFSVVLRGVFRTLTFIVYFVLHFIPKCFGLVFFFKLVYFSSLVINMS